MRKISTKFGGYQEQIILFWWQNTTFETKGYIDYLDYLHMHRLCIWMQKIPNRRRRVNTCAVLEDFNIKK